MCACDVRGVKQKGKARRRIESRRTHTQAGNACGATSKKSHNTKDGACTRNSTTVPCTDMGFIRFTAGVARQGKQRLESKAHEIEVRWASFLRSARPPSLCRY